MKSIGIFFGSDTGNTEKIATIIQNKLSTEISEIHDIAKSTKEDLESYNTLLLGIPTWYYGEAQCDWDDFLPTLKKINFKKKIVGLFGCGDQEDYSEYFCDALGILHKIVLKNGAKIIGYWPTDGYKFEESKGLLDQKNFLGLAIDEDRQPELTNIRIEVWINKISQEIK